MCGRFNLLAEEDEEEMLAIAQSIARRYEGKPELAMMARGEVFPTGVVPVIANSRKLKPMPFLMKWGLPLASGTGMIINTRSETASVRPMFRDSMQHRRCLIPAGHYYEWERSSRRKYAIRPQGSGLMYMAGLYRPDMQTGLPVFSVLTREAAPDIAFIHHRMPVILPAQAREAWLSPGADPERLMAMAAQNMTFTPVDSREERMP